MAMQPRLGIEIYEWVNRLARRLAAKPDAKGIMTISNKDAIRDLSNDILTKFMKYNVPRDALKSENDIKVIYNQIIGMEEQTLAKNLKTALTPQKTGDVLDLTGKKIDTSKPISGGKNVPETEAQILERLNRQNKESVERLKNKKLTDPEDLAHGGRTGTGLNYLLGEDDQNSRVPFKDGTKFDPKRRTVLKGIAALATLPIVGKFFKWAKPAAKATKTLTSVPIGNPPGMPAWFKPLVNRVIKEGEDTTKSFATKDREIVHSTKIGDDEMVSVYQDLDNGSVRIEYDAAGNMGEAPIQLDYKASQWVEPKVGKKGQIAEPGMKTSDEFSAVEAEPRVANYDGDIEFDGENIVSAVDDLLTDTTKLEAYATGKKPNIKKLLKSEQKQKKVNKLNEDQVEQAEYIEQKYGPGPDPSDLVEEASETVIKKASGGRVPLAGGKFLGEGLPAAIAYLRKKFGKDIIKKGELSKPMAPKTELKQAIAGFQKRNTQKIWEDETKVREAVDDIFSSGDYKMDAEMAAEALVENNPAAFGGKLIDDLDDATRSEIYGAVLRVVQSDLAKTLQLKRLSRPTKTLEGIEKTGTVNISDPNVADEFTRFMKETDPKGHKKIEEIVEITNFDPKGRKKNAFGGLAGMLGE